jgi:hypothetical protein
VFKNVCTHLLCSAHDQETAISGTTVQHAAVHKAAQEMKGRAWRQEAHLLADGAMAAAISNAVRPLPGDVARDTSLRSSCRGAKGGHCDSRKPPATPQETVDHAGRPSWADASNLMHPV